MKRVLAQLGMLIVIVLLVAIVAFVRGWLPLSLIGLGSTPTPSHLPSPSAAAENHVLRIGVDDRPSNLPFYAVSDFLDNKDKALKIEIVPIADAELRWQMLAAGRLQLACGSLDSFVQALSRQDAGTMIFKIGTSNGMDALLVGNGITDVRKLSGKKVSVAAGSPGAYLMAYFLDRLQMSPSEVQIVGTEDVRDAARLLEMGKVQGAWLWDPAARDLSAKGFHILVTSQGQDVTDDVCVANRDALSAKSDLLAFMRAWFSLMALLKNNPGLAREPIARKLKMTSSSLGLLLAGVRFADLAENQHMDADAVVRQMTRIGEFWKLTGAGAAVTIDGRNAVQLEPVSGVEIASPSSLFGKNGEVPSPAGSSPSPSAPAPVPSVHARFTPIDSTAAPCDSSPSPSPSSDP